MEKCNGPIEFIRKTGSGYIRIEFITFKKTKEGREKYSSVVSYELNNESLNIFFIKSDNPKQDFKKHKEYIKKEKDSMIQVTTLNWKGVPEMKILYVCEIISIEENFFKIKILTIVPK